MKVGDLVKYHRAGRPPKIGIVSDVDLRSDTYGGCVPYYCVEFADNAFILRDDHLEVINESR
jgi:hypothetical protein